MCTTCWEWIQSLAHVRYAIYHRGYHQLKIVFWHLYLYIIFKIWSHWMAQFNCSLSSLGCFQTVDPLVWATPNELFFFLLIFFSSPLKWTINSYEIVNNSLGAWHKARLVAKERNTCWIHEWMKDFIQELKGRPEESGDVPEKVSKNPNP